MLWGLYVLYGKIQGHIKFDPCFEKGGSYVIMAPFLYHFITIVLPSKATVPDLANALPSKEAPVLKVIDSMAITVPLKTEVVPNVAELPTCQKILEADAPPLRNTLRPEVVVNEEAI